MWPLFFMWNLLGAICAERGKEQMRICGSCGRVWCHRDCPRLQ